jgi:Raf kinase inhibitor-like YbhB/YbcL family protein
LIALAALAVLAALGTGALGCKSTSSNGPAPPPGVAPSHLAVTSSAIASGAAVPIDFTCDGANRSPPLTFSAPPHGTMSLAVVFDDPDAGGFTHWIAYDLPAETLSLPEGVELTSIGALAGENDFHRAGYAGPCPPRFEEHHYTIRVYALDARLDLPPEASRAAVDSAMNGHVLAQGSLVVAFSH